MTARDKAGAGPRKAGPDGRSPDPNTPPTANSTVVPASGASGAWCQYCGAVAVRANRRLRRHHQNANLSGVVFHQHDCPVGGVILAPTASQSAGRGLAMRPRAGARRG